MSNNKPLVVQVIISESQSSPTVNDNNSVCNSTCYSVAKRCAYMYVPVCILSNKANREQTIGYIMVSLMSQ